MGKRVVEPGHDDVVAFVTKAAGSNKRVYCGIDPGTSGAIALLCGPLHVVIDMPAFEVARVRRVPIPKKDRVKGGPKTKVVHGKTTRFDEAAIVGVFETLRVLRDRMEVIVEVASPMVSAAGKEGAQNVRTAYMVGYGFGMWPLFLRSHGFRCDQVEPQVWKDALSLTGKDKTASRELASGMWPDAPLARQDDHGRAEAMLLAEYLRRLREERGA